jgi:hypothetical protein
LAGAFLAAAFFVVAFLEAFAIVYSSVEFFKSRSSE